MVTATVVAAVVLGTWAPWSAGGQVAEGGTGHAVSAPGRSSPVGRPTVPVTTAPAPSAPATTVAPAPTGPDSGWIATLDQALPYSATRGGPAEGTLPALDPFGAKNVVAVIGRPGSDGWAQVELPVRPNGTVGWIQTATTTLAWTTYRVVVSLAARTITVTEGTTTLLTAPVAIGASRTPTPAGQTYVWELIRPDNPAGAYGPYILGLGMFSDAISVFNGGDAQIAIHGNDDASSIGQPVSHGCVRVANDLVTRLAGMLPLGTPVTIS